MKGETVVGASSKFLRLSCVLALAALIGCGGESEGDPSAANAGEGGSAGTKNASGGNASGGNGGAGASSGSGGSDSLPEGPPPSVDLLLVIDNSISMGDKQVLLSDALPGLVRRLVQPNCVDESGAPVGASQDGACADGELEFPPVEDLHLGVISSSLGSHGGDVCAGEDPDRFYDDKAHLIAELRGMPSWNDTGFLAWDPGGTSNTPPGESNAENLVAGFADHVRSAGETGCGYEATLEAWYRFLIDPEPPASVSMVNNVTVREGVDQTVLAQRDAFLRSDSLVYIVMLTDENDCSIIDEGMGWIVGRIGSEFHLPPATSTCSTEPNSPCCRSCATSETAPVSGCVPLSEDPACATSALPAEDDSPNLRCWDQKRRFGFDLLYPVSRYVTGLVSASITSASGATVENPLFAARGGKPARPPSRVVLSGIVGVPWQDIATEESLTGTGLTFLSADELRDSARWDMILGEPQKGTPPRDPLMIESNEPRNGTHPLTNSRLTPADSPNPLANVVNGHEHLLADDLQYACIFPLGQPRDCSDPALLTCPCSEPALAGNTPICQPPSGGTVGTTQYFAKVYPSLRQLEVLRDFGERSVVTSACPKVVGGDKIEFDYGYNPAVRAVVDQTRELLIGN
jgi:hypothetical protein